MREKGEFLVCEWWSHRAYAMKLRIKDHCSYFLPFLVHSVGLFFSSSFFLFFRLPHSPLFTHEMTSKNRNLNLFLYKIFFLSNYSPSFFNYPMFFISFTFIQYYTWCNHCNNNLSFWTKKILEKNIFSDKILRLLNLGWQFYISFEMQIVCFQIFFHFFSTGIYFIELKVFQATLTTNQAKLHLNWLLHIRMLYLLSHIKFDQSFHETNILYAWNFWISE